MWTVGWGSVERATQFAREARLEKAEVENGVGTAESRDGDPITGLSGAGGRMYDGSDVDKKKMSLPIAGGPSCDQSFVFLRRTRDGRSCEEQAFFSKHEREQKVAVCCTAEERLSGASRSPCLCFIQSEPHRATPPPYPTLDWRPFLLERKRGSPLALAPTSS